MRTKRGYTLISYIKSKTPPLVKSFIRSIQRFVLAPFCKLNYSEVSHLFVIAPPRSGTTLLCRILNKHPEILQTNEAGIALLLNNIINQSAKGREKGSGPAYSIEYKKEITTTLEKFAKPIIDDVFRKCAARHGKVKLKYLGDKHPHHDQCLEFLSNIYPQSVFIYLIRHPLDVICSIDRHEPSISTEKATKAWHRIASNYENFIESNPDKKIISLKYEDLVSNPTIVITKLLSDLGLNCEQSYFIALREIMGQGAYAHQRKEQNYQAKSGSYKEHYSEEQIAEILKFTNDYMKKYDYLH